jgi:hypothetical protein
VNARRGGAPALAALGLALGFAADVAHACPVCFSAKDEAQRQAFFDTTIFLTLLPLALIGGFIYWVARRVRHLEAAAQRDDAAPDAEPGPASR